MKVGCNYWASNAGTRMWKDWDADVVRRDFELMKAAGLQTIRVFPNWEDFQPLQMIYAWGNREAEMLINERPLPDTPCGRDGVDETQIQRFRWMAGVAEELGLELIVGLVTGWMSGVMYIPPAFKGKNVITDPLVLKWETRFVRCLVRELKDLPAIVMWELGNECNCMSPVANEAQAWNWTYMLTSAMRLEDPTRPICSGMHGLMGGADNEFHGVNWTIQSQGDLCDYMAAHPYPHTTSKAPARLDEHGDIRLALQASVECRQYGDLAKRPAFVEEIGTFSSSYCNDDTKAAFIMNTMFNSWVHGSDYFLWWCGFEHSILPFPPYTWSTWERELGMYDENFNLRKVGKALGEFHAFMDTVPVKKLPMFKRNAVCVMTREQDFRKFTENGWAAFVLAKQAGFDIEFQWINEPLRPADVYIVPGISGMNWSRSFEYKALQDAAKAGATLYLSLDGGDLAPFSKEVFGAEVRTRSTRKSPCVAFETFGETYKIDGSYRFVLNMEGGEALGTEATGNPVFIHNRYGDGDVYLMTLPLERYLSTHSCAFTGEGEPAWVKIYEEIGAKAIAKRVVWKSHRQVTLTEHFESDGKAWIVAVNNTGDAVDAQFKIRKGWHVSGDMAAEIPAHRGIVFCVEKD